MKSISVKWTIKFMTFADKGGKFLKRVYYEKFFKAFAVIMAVKS